MTTARRLAVVALLVGLPAVTPAQVKYPPRPDRVQLDLRYRIPSERAARVKEFRELEAGLARLGFERTRVPDDETDFIDPLAERFSGTIPSKNVLAVLDDPRIKSIQFRPTEFKLPDDPAARVGVRVGIPSGFPPVEQRLLHGQVVAHLGRLGFRQADGYDHAGYTLLRGDFPVGNLSRLLKDVRQEPAGWFASDTPASELPVPLRTVLPVRWVEVLTTGELTPFAPPALPANRAAFAPAVRTVLADAAAAARPLRVEVVYDRPRESAELEALRSRLLSAYVRSVVNPATMATEPVPATLEGAAGNVLTIDFPAAADVERFAVEPGVVFVRLPRPAVTTVGSADGPSPTAAQVLGATRLDQLHAKGYRGQGVRVVVIAPEFIGLVDGKLAAGDKEPVPVIDLTAEFSRDFSPAPANQRLVGGTAAARAVRLAAPDAKLVLVRVDPAAYFQVLAVARLVRGDVNYSEAMQSRLAELSARTADLKRRNLEAIEEFRLADADTSGTDRARGRLLRARTALDQVQAQEQQDAVAIARALALQTASKSLAGADVVVNTLVWEGGFPNDGLSELSRVLDAEFAGEAAVAPRTRSATRPKPPRRPLWVQAASPSAGSVWAGPSLDLDENAALEFADPGKPRPAGEWTRELNFLGLRAADGTLNRDLPAGAVVRLTAQWRETHDATAYGSEESIFPLTIRVFRQLDPEGKVRASDELREVARTVGGPYRLLAAPGYGVYEQVIEVPIAEAGRYAVRIDGREVYDVRLPALRRRIEITPRVAAEWAGATPPAGRPVWVSYADRNVGVGVPGDAKSAITVAASERPFGDVPAGLTGAGPGLPLLTKPDLVANGSFGGGPAGSGVAAGFVGGLLAALVESGAPPERVMAATSLRPGGPAVVSEGWLKVLPKR